MDNLGGRRGSKERQRKYSNRIIENEWLSKSVEDLKEPQEPAFQVSYKSQYFAALAANFGAFAFGTVMSWTATALPDMRNDENFTGLSIEQESLVASIVALGCVASGPIAGFSVERFGRRKTMLLLTPPFMIGWLLIIFASDLAMMIVGRLITGFAGGAFTMAAPIFTAEMSSADVRGMLSAGFDMMITIGQLYIFAVGAYLPWRWQAVSCAVIPLICHALLMFVPESPRYLMSKGRKGEALEALCWFRGASRPEQIEGELENITNFEESETSSYVSIVDSSESSGPASRAWRALLDPPTLKPIMIIMCLFMLQELCAIDAVLFYTVDIFAASGVTLSSYLSTIIVGVVQVMGAFCAAGLVDRKGRRPLLTTSLTFMALSLGLLGAFFYVKVADAQSALDYMSWAPLTSLIVFVVAYSIGLGPITYMIMGELLPSHVKGLASSILIMIKWVIGFLVALFFENILLAIGSAAGYWLFGAFCAIGVVFVLCCLPETKGKTLEEIQQGFAATTRINSSDRAARKTEKAPLLLSSSSAQMYGTAPRAGSIENSP